jgi:hypothetical protein
MLLFRNLSTGGPCYMWSSLSANSCICNFKLTIFLERFPQFTVIRDLLYANLLYARQIIRSLSIAYNEVQLYSLLCITKVLDISNKCTFLI